MPSTARKQVSGVRSHHKATENVVEFEVVIPDPPDHLNAKAKKHWKGLVPDLADAGVMTNVDTDALAVYCTNYVALLDEQKKLEGEETIIPGRGDVPMRNPRIALINQIQKQVQAMQIQFGITPKGRAKVKSILPKGGTPKGKPTNRFAQLGF